jgi:ribosomal protein S18 acetylase RimI-like enzyme
MPPEIEIKILRPGDDLILANVAPHLFDNPIDPAFTTEFLADPHHHIAVAIYPSPAASPKPSSVSSLVVGFASGVHYLHPDKPPELWINEVAVAPTHRRRGQSLLRALLDVGRAHHCVSAWVLTHRSNPAAMALYAAAGGTEGADDSGPPDALLGYSFNLVARTLNSESAHATRVRLPGR